MALDAEIGSATANSYVTTEEADAYFTDRMHSSSWDSVSDQDPFLISASQMLDWYTTWKGYKYTSEQSMQWPRAEAIRPDGRTIENNVIPPEVKTAVFELAFSSIESDRTTDDPLAGIGQLKAGSLMIKAGAEKPNQTNAKVIPSHVSNIISDLTLNNGGVVRLLRA